MIMPTNHKDQEKGGGCRIERQRRVSGQGCVHHNRVTKLHDHEIIQVKYPNRNGSKHRCSWVRSGFQRLRLAPVCLCIYSRVDGFRLLPTPLLLGGLLAERRGLVVLGVATR